MQNSELVGSTTYSAQVFTEDRHENVDIEKVRRTTDNLEISIKDFAKSLKQARNRLRNLKKLLDPSEIGSN